MELMRLDIGEELFQDAFNFFNDPQAEHSNLNQMTPVSLKEIGIDFEMRKFKLGSDLSDFRNINTNF